MIRDCLREYSEVKIAFIIAQKEVGMRHLEGPKNPDGLNLGIHILQSTHVYIYAKRRDEILD